MSTPFAFPPTLDDLRAAAVVVEAACRGNAGLTFDALRAIAPGVRKSLPGTAVLPFAAYSITDELVIVAISGTANTLQWVLNFLGSGQTTVPPIPGQVGFNFARGAAAVVAAAQADVVPALPTRRLVCLGHSLGGAMAQVVLAIWGPQAGNGAIAITFGCPRVGNPAFADALAGQVVRIENTVDPIVVLPPVVWAGTGSPWTWPFGLQPSVFRHAGQAQTLAADGTLTDGEQHISLFDAYAQLESLAAPTHEMGEYLSRLNASADYVGIGGDFDDPPALNQIDEFLAPEPERNFQGVGPMAICQGKMYFRTSEEAQGWSEAWFMDGTVEDMLAKIKALLTARANFLAGTCEIHAYAASIVEPGVARRSRTVRLETPQHAAVSIKDIDAAGRTNDTMDAIDMQINSQTFASRRVAAFRGIPDDWIGGSKLTDKGREGLKVIQTYIGLLKTNLLNLRVFKRGVAGYDIKPVVSMAQDPASKLIVVTCTAHGFPNNSVITLRKVKANPMLKGKWRIGVVDPNTFLLAGSSKFYVNSSNDGTVQLYGNLVDGIQDYDFAGISTRKTGRPFGSRRGKQSAKLLHH